MALVRKSVLVGYSAQRMFGLVDGVERYPEFLPWCGGAELEHRDGQITRASIHIDYRGIHQSFRTENRTQPPELIEIRLAMAMGGKAFVTMTGDVAAVQSAVEAAAQVVGQKGMLVNKVVIPHPRPELLNEMI